MPELGLLCVLTYFEGGGIFSSGLTMRYEYYIVADAPACQRIASSKNASSGTPNVMELNKLKIYCGQYLDRCEKVPLS